MEQPCTEEAYKNPSVKTRAKHFHEQLNRIAEGTKYDEWFIEEIILSGKNRRGQSIGSKCLCGAAFDHGFVIQNRNTKQKAVIGNCCARRFMGMRLSWAGKENYLRSALACIRNQKGKEFVNGLLDRIPMWGSGLLISEKQKQWLESITSHKWPGQTWEARE